MLKIGNRVKHKFRNYKGKIVDINDKIYILWDQTDIITYFTKYEFNKLMELDNDKCFFRYQKTNLC